MSKKLVKYMKIVKLLTNCRINISKGKQIQPFGAASKVSPAYVVSMDNVICNLEKLQLEIEDLIRNEKGA